MKSSISLPVLTLVTTLSAKVIPPRVQSNTCSAVRYPPPSVRLPPKGGYHGRNFASWTLPPPEHLYGIYHASHTSIEQWIPSFVNFRSERYPVYPSNDEYPAGSQSEVGSWSTCANPNATDCKDPNGITTVFGYNVPIGAQGPTDTKYTAAWTYNATGELEGIAGNLFAVVAWGTDHDGFDYFAQYETELNSAVSNSGGQINVVSRNEKGLSPITYICLTSSLKQLAEELGDADLSTIVSRIKSLLDDGRRSGEGPVECDNSCVDNIDVFNNGSRQLQRRDTQETQQSLTTVDVHKHMYPLGYRRGHTLPWWGWMAIGLIFGLPLVGGFCIAVPVALCKGHRARKAIRVQRAAQGHARDPHSSSVVEPEMVHATT